MPPDTSALRPKMWLSKETGRSGDGSGSVQCRCRPLFRARGSKRHTVRPTLHCCVLLFADRCVSTGAPAMATTAGCGEGDCGCDC